MNMLSNFTPEQIAALERVRKLMAMADHPNTNESEAANAATMASAILARINLDMDALDAAGSRDTREDAKLVGGFYQHERDMWEAIAELNFCYYWTVKIKYDAEKAKKENRKWAHHHRVVGRKVNIVASQVMADYLLQTIERLVKEWCLENRPFDKYHPRSSTAIAFRKGCAARIIEMINDRRRALLREEKRKQAEQQSAARNTASATTPNAMVVSGLIKSEAAANYDFMNGEGAWQRRLDRNAAWEAKWEAEAAAEAAEHERKMATDPKYRKAQEREDAKRERRWEREANRDERQSERLWANPAYRGGYEKGATVNLDPQIKSDPMKRLG